MGLAGPHPRPRVVQAGSTNSKGILPSDPTVAPPWLGYTAGPVERLASRTPHLFCLLGPVRLTGPHPKQESPREKTKAWSCNTSGVFPPAEKGFDPRPFPSLDPMPNLPALPGRPCWGRRLGTMGTHLGLLQPPALLPTLMGPEDAR